MSQVSLIALSCTTRRSVSIARFLRLWRNGRFAGPREMAYAAAIASTEAPPTGRHEAAQSRPAQPPAFPGCKPVHLPRTETDRFEGRLDRSLHHVGERNGEHHHGGFRRKYSVYRCGSSGHNRNGVLRNEVWEDSGEVRKAARRHAGAS